MWRVLKKLEPGAGQNALASSQLTGCQPGMSEGWAEDDSRSSDLHGHVCRPRHIHTTINETIYFKKPPCLTFPVTPSSVRHRCESIRQDIMVVTAVVTVRAEATSFRSHQLEGCGQESCVSGPDVSRERRTDNRSHGSAQPPPHFPGTPRASLVPWKPNVLT